VRGRYYRVALGCEGELAGTDRMTLRTYAESVVHEKRDAEHKVASLVVSTVPKAKAA